MNIVSLFAGCGGFDLGFKMAGFNVIWANEYDKTIHSTYKLNHPNTAFCEEDIRSINMTDIPDCDGIIGGPPCQSWSIGGKGLGIKDERGKLFLDYIRIVNYKKPKFFVIENVAGILEEKHKQVFSLFLTQLGNAGYNVKYSLLNAADFSIPQDRFRVFIVGMRKDLDVNFHFPEKIEGAKITLAQVIGDIIEDPQFSSGLIPANQTNQGLWNHDVYNGPYSTNYMHSNRVRSWDEVSYTIQAQASNAPQHPQAPKMEFSPNRGRMFKVGYEHLYRRLSVRECARIQTFPDTFRFIYNDIKDGYKMVGNAVPPRLAYFLAMQIKKTLIQKGFLPNTDNTPIIETKQRPTKKMLVGCYKDKSHLDWILQNQMYNVRKGDRGGAIGKSGIIDASILLLYNFSNPSEYKLFELDQAKQIVADYDTMVAKHYPGAKPDREYTLCPIVECINSTTPFDINGLREEYAPRVKYGVPFIVE